MKYIIIYNFNLNYLTPCNNMGVFSYIYVHTKTIEMITIDEIRKLQEGYNVTTTQKGIESGNIWKFEGSTGRFEMTCLEAGICFLGDNPTKDYYGNTIPSRSMLELSTKGSLKNAQDFWQRVWDGDFETIEALEEMFGSDVKGEVA